MRAYDKGWLSALIDGEGCLYFGKTNKQFQAHCEIANASRKFLLRAQRLTGGSLVKTIMGNGHSDRYCLVIQGNNLRKLLKYIRLVIKERQRVLMLEALRIMSRRTRLGYIRYPATIRPRLFVIEREFRKLNQRGVGKD
jgi:hypothetical protein